MSKEGPTTTSTQTQSQQLSPEALLAQQQLLAALGFTVNPFLQNQPQYGVMGMNPLQTLAADLAVQNAHAFSTNPQLSPYDVFGMGNQWQSVPAVGPVSLNAQQASFTNPAVAQQAAAAISKAAQMAPGDIKQWMNPYIDTALNPVLDRLRQQQAEVQSQVGANAAAAHMFGGSREAVQRMLADRNYRQQLGETTGTMLHQGWQSAAQLEEANVAKQQASNLLNAQLENAVNMLNAQLGTGVSTANMQAANQLGIANMQSANQLMGIGAQLSQAGPLQTQRLAFEGAQNDANRFLTALNNQWNMNTGNANTQMALINQLNALGTQQQQLGQQALNIPYQRLNDLINATRAFQGGSTTTGTTVGTSEKPIDWASLIIGGLGLLSDREDKTDVKRLGIDPATGLPFYSYRYKGEPKSYPKTVGPMAQDVEKMYPDRVREIGGHKVIQGA